MYQLSKLLDNLAAPSTLLLLTAVAGAAVLWRKPGDRWARRLLLASISVMVAVAFSPLSEWMTQPLENRFPMPRIMPQHVDGIVLLGGGFATELSEKRGVPQLGKAGDRVATFVALARRYPNARLVFTGGNASPFAKRLPEAFLARQFFHEIGLDAEHFVYESRSRNTHENALYSYRLVHPAVSETWLMVTSAEDVPRAVGSFRAVGWPVIPMPSDYHAGGSRICPGLTNGLALADWSVHEWLGLAYYWLRGWSPELFPGPKA